MISPKKKIGIVRVIDLYQFCWFVEVINSEQY